MKTAYRINWFTVLIRYKQFFKIFSEPETENTTSEKQFYK